MRPSDPNPKLRSTFRDPAGSLQLEEGRAVRFIHPASRSSVLEFVESPLCLRMQQRGELIAATVDDSADGLRLVHPRIAIPTYPWEWTPSQWLAAAELTLRLGEEALDDGWILKDATPLNILFVGARPVLVDILSFERRDPASSIWLAYGQYMRTFLLPLLMRRMCGWPLELTLLRRDGYEPAEVYRSLSWSQRLSKSAFWPITLPAWLERRGSGAAAGKPSSAISDSDATLHILKRNLDGLRKRTRRALPPDTASDWSDYQATLTHYTAAQSEAKHAWVRETLEFCKPARVLDIGANTGEYSELAASSGAEVVALERDAETAERLFRRSLTKAPSILTVHADLGRPTPAVGWENAESSALLDRFAGRFELVMMLAVIHHLILLEQIPIAAIVSLCDRLTRRYLLIEWVPVSDTMFQSLMRGRDDLYGHLSEADLLAACDGRFHLMRRHALENGRVLLLFEKLEAG